MCMKSFTKRLVASLGVFLMALAFAGQTHATFPGKNGKIAFTGSNGDVYTMNPDGSNVMQLTFFSVNGGSTCCAVWSADGRQLVFAAAPDIYFAAVAYERGRQQSTGVAGRGFFLREFSDLLARRFAGSLYAMCALSKLRHLPDRSQ